MENRIVEVKDGNAPAGKTVESVTLQVTQESSSNTVQNAALQATANASGFTGNLGGLFGVMARTRVDGGLIHGVNAALYASIDVAAGANSAGGPCYGVLVESLVSSGGRGANAAPTAFFGVSEEAAAANSPTTFLFDLGRNATKNVASAANGTVLFTTLNANTAQSSGALRIRVNGAVKWIALYNNVG